MSPRLEAIECQLISVLYTRRDFLRLSRLDVWSDPVWPTSLPAGRQVAENLRQVLLLVCLPLPGRTPPRAGHLYFSPSRSPPFPRSLNAFRGTARTFVDHDTPGGLGVDTRLGIHAPSEYEGVPLLNR